MMHVAVSGWLLGPHSGANRRLVCLLRHVAPLLRDDERVTLLCRNGTTPPDLPARIETRMTPIPGGPSWLRATHEAMRLPGELRNIAATVCDHGFLPAPRTSCALALTVHDTRAADGWTSRPRWLARLALRRAAERAAVIIVPSEFTRRCVTQIAPRARVVVVHNGVELPPPGNVDAVRPTLGMLLHVGHLEPRKNLEVLVRALALLPQDSPHHVALVGMDAGSGASLSRLARSLGVAQRVRMLGPVDDAQLANLYASAAAVVVPSAYEGFGLAALEGLAWGRPTLVADAGSLPEVAGDAATALPTRDAAAWASAITRLDDTAIARQARRARAAKLSWDKAAVAMLDVWRSLG